MLGKVMLKQVPGLPLPSLPMGLAIMLVEDGNLDTLIRSAELE